MMINRADHITSSSAKPRIKLLSRTIPAARAARLRLLWFIIGMAFGIGCGISAAPSGVANADFAAVDYDSDSSAADFAESADKSSTDKSTDKSADKSADKNQSSVSEKISKEDISRQAPKADSKADNKSDNKADNKADSAESSSSAAKTIPSATQEIPEVPALAPVISPTVRGGAESLQYPQTHRITASRGDSFVNLLGKVGISAQEAHNLLGAIGKAFNPRAIDVDDVYSVTIDKLPDAEKPIVTKLSLPVSELSRLEITRKKNGGYSLKKIDVPTVKKLARSGGKIDSSLYETVTSNGLPSSMISEIIKAYSYDVDFQRDIRQGDEIDVVFEKIETTDGKTVGYGNVIYASLGRGERELRIYRHTDKGGFSDYYNARGESVRKALLRTPINGARISSGFGMRNHPILGYSKMHQGVDFAAAIGTPVYAAGDGIISFVGRKGGYGNYLQIKHSSQYSSAYAHLSRFASGVVPGKKVKQGQIVAYVGNSGMSTGPHLHYEIHANGRQVNPANVKFKTGNVLAGNELKNFKRNVVTLHAQLDNKGKASDKFAAVSLSKPKNIADTN